MQRRIVPLGQQIRRSPGQVGLPHDVAIEVVPAALAGVRADLRFLLHEQRGEVRRQPEDALFAGRAPEFHQCHLDARMLGELAALVLGRDGVRNADGHVEEIGLPGGPVMRDGGLDQVARRGELIGIFEVVPVIRGPELVAVMCGHDAGDQFVHELAQRRIVDGLQGERAGFNHLHHHRAPGVPQAAAVAALEGGAHGVERAFDARCITGARVVREGAEGRDLPVLIEPGEERGDAGRAVAFQARLPKSVAHRDGVNRHGTQPRVRAVGRIDRPRLPPARLGAAAAAIPRQSRRGGIAAGRTWRPRRRAGPRCRRTSAPAAPWSRRPRPRSPRD